MAIAVQLKGRLKGRLILLFLSLIARVPLYPARAIGRLLGRLALKLEVRTCKVARQNLKHCLPALDERSREDILHGRMLHIGQTLFETPRVWNKSADWLKSHILDVNGIDFFREALLSDKGMVLLVPHQGNWEVVGLWIAKQTAITSLYEPPKIKDLEEWIKTSRQNSGAKLVPTNSRGVAALLQALKRGETIGILPDQQPPGNAGVFAPLFKKPALTMTLVHKLLQRCEANVLFCAALRTPGGWSIHFTKSDPAIHSANQDESLTALNRGVERIAELELSQYQWEYKRFRQRPQGFLPVY